MIKVRKKEKKMREKKKGPMSVRMKKSSIDERE